MSDDYVLHASIPSRFFPKDQNGHELMPFAFYFSFHFLDGYRREYRLRAASVCEDYFRQYGRHLKWMITPQKCRWRRVPEGYTMRQWLAGFPDEDWAWSMIFHSGRVTSEAANYEMVGMGNSTRTHSSSSLYLFLPANQFVEDTHQRPISLYLRWAQMLQARHGTAGFALVPPEDTPTRARTTFLAEAFGKDFPGIELGDFIGASNALHGLLSPNWLNLIDADYVARLGGVESIKAKLSREPASSSVSVHPYEGGLILSSGENPVLCQDSQPAKPPTAYGPVARLLKPLRTPTPWGTWGCPKDESLKWMARFD